MPPTDGLREFSAFWLIVVVVLFCHRSKVLFFPKIYKNGNLATRHTKYMFKPHIFGNRQIVTIYHNTDDMWMLSRGTSLNFGVDKVESLIFPFVFTFVARTPTLVG